MSSILSPAVEVELQAPPLVLQWNDDNPLSSREVRLPANASPRVIGLEAPPWYHTGNEEEPFDFSDRISQLAADVTQRCEPLSHIDVSKILFTMAQARNGHAHGLQARVTPLRFQHGQRRKKRRGLYYQVQQFIVHDVELLYLVTFCLPRFLDQTFDEKMITLFHELYHISPQMDGDLRRHEGRYSLHTHSKQEYDRHMADLVRQYLSTKPDSSLFDFLRLDFAQLQHRHKKVISVVVPRPKVILVT